MISIENVIGILAAYMIGSIPTAVWWGKAFYGVDVREHGSGNAGATNTFRVLGKKAGIPVMIFDIFKGWAATNVVFFLHHYNMGSVYYTNFQLLLGLVAIIGHLYPIFTKFKGGKGVATSFGMLVALHPEAALCCLVMFAFMLLTTKYVSLSSMVAGFTFPLSIAFWFEEPAKLMVLFALLVAFVLILTHQKNIERLFSGTESKANIFKKKEA